MKENFAPILWPLKQKDYVYLNYLSMGVFFVYKNTLNINHDVYDLINFFKKKTNID